MNNNRNQLNTGNKAFSLEEHSYHSKICNFEKELLLVTKKKKTLVKRGNLLAK